MEKKIGFRGITFQATFRNAPDPISAQSQQVQQRHNNETSVPLNFHRELNNIRTTTHEVVIERRCMLFERTIICFMHHEYVSKVNLWKVTKWPQMWIS
jgi:hypothetical protein